MEHHTPAQEDPKELARAQAMWSRFMNITKYAIVAVVVILAGLAGAFVTF